MKRFYLLAVILLFACSLQAQLKGKIKDILAGDVFFKQLKESYEKVQGESGVPNFLRKTMQHPERISLEDFRKEKARYYSLCREYNEIIDDIIAMVNGMESIKEIKEISLIDYRSRITAISTKFHDFFADLNRYHSEALVLDLLIDVFKFAKPIITQLISEGKETIRRIIVEELKSLKLTPIPWEPTEEVVASKRSPSSQEEIVAKVGIALTDHYRALNLQPGAMMPEINQAYSQLKLDYSAQLNGTSNSDVQEFFGQMLEKVEAAKKYFDTNPPKAREPILEAKSVNESRNSSPQPSGNGGTSALKSELEGLLRGAKYMTKEQLMEEMEAVLKKY